MLASTLLLILADEMLITRSTLGKLDNWMFVCFDARFDTFAMLLHALMLLALIQRGHARDEARYGGCCGVISAFVCVVRLGMSTKPVHAILCLAENVVSNVATRPDDVHTLYSGETVESNNADAEGRLVLADGVASAIKYLNPEIIVDMATLTGAQGVTTGQYFGACYCSNRGLEQVAAQTGRFPGDLLYPLPFAPEFFRPKFKSAVANMKNSVADRSNAQKSRARDNLLAIIFWEAFWRLENGCTSTWHIHHSIRRMNEERVMEWR
jgi:hypothetical protein